MLTASELRKKYTKKPQHYNAGETISKYINSIGLEFNNDFDDFDDDVPPIFNVISELIDDATDDDKNIIKFTDEEGRFEPDMPMLNENQCYDPFNDQVDDEHSYDISYLVDPYDELIDFIEEKVMKNVLRFQPENDRNEEQIHDYYEWLENTIIEALINHIFEVITKELTKSGYHVHTDLFTKSLYIQIPEGLDE